MMVRPHDTRSTLRGQRRSSAGFGILELLATIAMLAVMARFGLPHVADSDFALFQAHAQLVADLRAARAHALVTGDHFQLAMTSPSTYVTQRMGLVDDEWTASAEPTVDRTLPRGVHITRGAAARFEFDTRGMLVDPVGADLLEMHDTRTGSTRQITVWPSGQVQS
jgi:hypothetical protein